MVCLTCHLDSSQYQFLSMDYQPHMTNQFVKHSEIAGVIKTKQKFRLYPTRPKYPTLPRDQTNQPIRTKPFICRDLNCNKLYQYLYVINFSIKWFASHKMLTSLRASLCLPVSRLSTSVFNM